MKPCPCLFLLGLTAMSASVLLASGPDSEATPEVKRLVKQLGDDDFEKREAASKRLAEIGESALDALHQALSSDDAEVRKRAEQLVAAIENKLSTEVLRLTGHTGEVWCVAVSADGKCVLTGGADKTLRLWDADTGKQLRLFEGHTARVVGAALSPDGKRALSGGDDKTVRVWDATTGKELRRMAGHDGIVYGVCFGPDGQAMSGSADRTMRLWDLNTGKRAGAFPGHTREVREVAYSNKAKLAATCGLYETIHLWNPETGKEVRKIAEHGAISSVCFSPDGKRVLSAAGDKTLQIWDVETGKELKRIDDANACCAAFSPDGKRIVSGGWHDRTVRVWDAETGKELRKYEHHTGPVVGVAFFPDGKRIASASGDGTARFWRAPR